MSAVLNCVKVAKEGGTIAIAPEGNRCYSGRTGYMNPAIASLAKILKLPVALFRIEGGYGVHPRWSDVVRRGKMRAYVSRVIEPEELAKLSKQELLEQIESGLAVDEAVADGEFRSERRAEYLERAMYVCPWCGLSEFESHGNEIECKRCRRRVSYGTDKRLSGVGFSFPFEFVAQWYDYQESFVLALDPGDWTEKPMYTDSADLYEVIVYERKRRLRRGPARKAHRRAQPQGRAGRAHPRGGCRTCCRACGQPGKSGTDHGTSGTGGGSMKLLIKKEWKLTVTPVPLLFLLLSALVLVPSYPYYVTFFYNALGIFLMLQAARENRDVYYMALLPLTKRDLVRARFSTIVTLQLLQALVCVPFMLLRRGYAEINNPVGIEANLAFLGFGFMLMGLFDLVFLPMHYKNGYDLGKPFVISSIVLFFAIVLLEALDHIVPYMKTVCESYASADLVRQLPVLLGGMAVYALEVWLAYQKSAARFEKVDL